MTDQYDYPRGQDGPLAPLYARSANPGYPGMIAPPKGWIPLVLALDEELSDIFPNYTIAQVKEKFGGLRFYIDSVGETITGDFLAERFYGLISQAEEQSFHICQVCGAPARTHQVNLLVGTLCAKHTVIS